MGNGLVAGSAPVSRKVRAYFQAVDRVGGVVGVFDPATIAMSIPPGGWVDLGECAGFTRKSGTKVEALVAGAPGVTVGQVRTSLEATVSLAFESWGKLQMALTCGSQQMNVLAVQAGAAARGSGGVAVAASAIAAGSTATVLQVSTGGFVVGDVVVVDVDFGGATGFVGSGVSGGYVKATAAAGLDVDYVRRVSLNVGRVVAVTATTLTLGAGLMAGVPTSAMSVAKVVGFCDREGGSFFQEWSGLFVVDGVQGDRVCFYYPRLQSLSGTIEAREGLVGVQVKGGGLERMRLTGSFRALPVRDTNDGEMVVCFRSYLPGVLRAV